MWQGALRSFSVSGCSDRVRCGSIVVQHHCMHVAVDAIVRIAADDDAAGAD